MHLCVCVCMRILSWGLIGCEGKCFLFVDGCGLGSWELLATSDEWSWEEIRQVCSQGECTERTPKWLSAGMPAACTLIQVVHYPAL